MSGKWVEIASLEEIKDKKLVRVDNDLEILLVRIKDSVFAVENRCSHDEKTLSDGKIIEKTIECRYHGAKFDLETGKALKMPAVTPINIFKTKIENGKIFVLTD